MLKKVSYTKKESCTALERKGRQKFRKQKIYVREKSKENTFFLGDKEKKDLFSLSQAGQLRAFLPDFGYEDILKSELRIKEIDIVLEWGSLLFGKAKCPDSENMIKENRIFWPINIWYNPILKEVKSISDAAQYLKSLQRNWSLFPSVYHRRAALIQSKLPYVSSKPLNFPQAAPEAPLGSWTLLEQGLILAATHCRSPFANGVPTFVENTEDPPSRAYLKLWECFAILGFWPKAGDKVVDLGACPGGWSWVLHQLGCHVIAVDKAPLEPKIDALPQLQFWQESAFGIEPQDFVRKEGRAEWLLSDMACYPEKLWRLVLKWRQEKACRHVICTLKFQGETDFQVIEDFLTLPDVKIMHLFNNKHELTVYIPPSF